MDAFLTADIATNWRDAADKKIGGFQSHQHFEVSVL